MRITFLGTGTSQGIPIIGCKCRVCASLNPKDHRLRSSVMIEVEETPTLKGEIPNANTEKLQHPLGRRVKRFVIDTGPDFRQQMLREKVDNIAAVIYTHEHRDHVAGLDDLRAFNFIMKKKIDLYATKEVQKSIHQQFGYVFTEKKYPGIPEVTLHTIENKPFTVADVIFLPILVRHLHLPVFGFRIGNFSYITDANFIPEEEKKKIYGSDVLVLNALRKEKHVSHFNLEEAVNLARECNCKKTFFTHISHQMGLHEEVEDELPDNIHLGYDGLKMEI